MREVYLLRHGQTEWNLEGRLQGHLNSNLTDLGKIQAKTCGQVQKHHLNDSPIKLVASPLGRCIETAQIVASALGVSAIEKDSRLKEICFGRWEGMNRHEIQESDGAAFRARKADRWNVPAPDGESYRDVADRVMSWFSELPDERIVAISHGCAGRILRGVHAGLDHSEIYRLEERHDAVHVLREGGIVEELNPEQAL